MNGNQLNQYNKVPGITLFAPCISWHSITQKRNSSAVVRYWTNGRLNNSFGGEILLLLLILRQRQRRYALLVLYLSYTVIYSYLIFSCNYYTSINFNYTNRVTLLFTLFWSYLINPRVVIFSSSSGVATPRHRNRCNPEWSPIQSRLWWSKLRDLLRTNEPNSESLLVDKSRETLISEVSRYLRCLCVM